ncbi:MAG: exo-alpha-sialidase [Blastocatellia bacterium]|nr:exo-alpha-sialidase [Blastocatellia bacterium]
MQKTFFFLTILILVLAGYTSATKAKRGDLRSSRSQTLMVKQAEQLDYVEELMKADPNQFASFPISSHLEQLANDQSLPNAWLFKPTNFRNLSQSTKAYLLRKYLPQLRSPLSDLNTYKNPSYTDLVLDQVSSSENIRVNDPKLDKDDRTQNGTSAAAFGNTIVVSFNDSAGLSSENIAGVAVSKDGGANWRQARVPTYPDGSNLGQGVVAVNSSGVFYYAVISLDADDRSSIGVSRSKDGEKWKKLINGSTTSSRRNDFQDKPWIAIDRNNSSDFKDRVYLTWTSFLNNEGKTAIMFARSSRDGKKFLEPVRIGESREGSFVQGSMVTVGLNGEIYIAWTEGEFGRSQIKFVKSIDGGKSFAGPNVIASFRDPAYPANGVFSGNTFPSIAADTSRGIGRGNIYIVFAGRPEARPDNREDRADLFFIRSTDRGKSWESAKAIKDDNSIAEQILPSVGVNSEGAVAITWYDRRNDLTNLSLLDIYATVSTDGGANFFRSRRITTTNWPLIPTPFNLRGGFHGDYNQVATRGEQFIFNWADDRSGTDSDIYVALRNAQDLTSVSPDFIVAAETPFKVVKPGEVAEFQINTLSVDGAEGSLSFDNNLNLAGLSFRFASSSVSIGTKAFLNIATTAETEPGPYFIPITATRNGQARTTFVRLTVLEPTSLVKAPTNVTRNRTGSIGGRSSIDVAGNINVVWLDDAPGIFAIFFTRSTDGGKTFADPTMLERNEGTFLGAPLIGANEKEIYIVHLELFEQPQFAFKIIVRRSTNGGKSFEPPKVVTEDNNIFIMPETFQLDVDGTLHLGGTSLNAQGSIDPKFFAFDIRSTDQGSSFSFNKIYESKSPLSSPVVAVEGDGKNVRAILADFDRSNGGLFFARSTDGGVTYSKATLIPSNINRLIFATVFFEAGASTNVLISEGNFNQGEFALFFSRSDSNDQFSPKLRLGEELQTILSASLASDGQGNIVAAIEGSPDQVFAEDYLSRIYYCNSVDSGKSFSQLNVFTPERGGDFSPAVLLDLTGDFLIVWNGYRRGVFDVLQSVSTDRGKSFLSVNNLSNNAGISSYSDFAFDQNGKLQILWQDNSAGSTDIFQTKLGREVRPGSSDLGRSKVVVE